MVILRELRTRFDLLHPNVIDKVIDSQHSQIAARSHIRGMSFEPGDWVMIDNYGTIGNKRVPGKIIKELSPSIFRAQAESDQEVKRHVDQMKPIRRSQRIANRMQHK